METTLVQPASATADRSFMMMFKTLRLLKQSSASNDPEVFKQGYHALPQSTRDYLNEMFKDEFTHNITVLMILTKMVYFRAEPQMIEDVAHYLKNASTQHIESEIAPSFRWDSEITLQYQPIRTDITGLRYYSKLDDTYAYRIGTALRNQSDTAKRQCDALFRLHEYAHEIANYTEVSERFIRVTTNNTVEPYQIAQLTIENPERVEEIISIMEDRQAADSEVIAAILFSSNKALAEGNL
jgi:hypothetical protein